MTSWIASWRLISTAAPFDEPQTRPTEDDRELVAMGARRNERDAGGGNGAWREVLLDERSSESSPWVPTARPCREICPKTAGCKGLVFPLKAGNKPDRNG